MIPKRVKQFYINVTDLMKQEDYKYVKSILSDKEYELFNILLKSEQKHSVRIAREIEDLIDNGLVSDRDIIENKDTLIKTALIHDVGKIRRRLNVFDKSIIVILNKLSNGKLKDFKKSKKVQCYYNHSEYSYEILKEIEENLLLLEIVKNHHSDDNRKIIKFFQKIDDKN